MNELSAEVGLSSPNHTAMYDKHRKLKSAIFDLSINQLLMNRKEHVLKARNMPDYKGDVQFMKNNIIHLYYRPIIAMGGAGNTGFFHILLEISSIA